MRLSLLLASLLATSVVANGKEPSIVEVPVSVCEVSSPETCNLEELFYMSKYAGRDVGEYRAELQRLKGLLDDPENTERFYKWIQVRIHLLTQFTADEGTTTRAEAERVSE